MAGLQIQDSVGRGGRNRDDDVQAVRDRFVALGFDWIKGVQSGTDARLIRVIQLFQSICAGEAELKSVGRHPGRIVPGDGTHLWLSARNAPRWVEINWEPWDSKHLGWEGTPEQAPHHVRKNAKFGTSWLLNAIDDAGYSYSIHCTLHAHDDCPPMWVRDCSPERGGRATDHGTHQTGLNVDLHFPFGRPTTMPGPSSAPRATTIASSTVNAPGSSSSRSTGA